MNKGFLCLISTFTLLVFTCSTVAATDIYKYDKDDPGNSFAEAIMNRDALYRTQKIKKTATRVKSSYDENKKGEVRLEAGLGALKDILFYAKEELSLDSKSESEMNFEARLLESIDTVWRQMSGSIPVDEKIEPESWKIDKFDFTVTGLSLDFNENYIKRVPSSPEIYEAAIDALGILMLTHDTLQYVYKKAAVDAIGKLAEKRVDRWQTYFDKSIPQWPWELALVNGPIYAHALRDQPGMGKVPEWQMIVAHPDVLLQYVDAADDGDQFKPALMVEVVGGNFWSWGKGAEQKGPWGFPVPLGAGFIVTYSDRSNTDDWGFGGILHINHLYNFGVTSHGGDIGFFVSVDLAKLFENKKKKADKYLDMFGLKP